MTLLIGAEHLHLRIAGRTVVKDVSIRLRDGECVGVIGPNGCGKSSLLRLLYRVVRPQSGEVRWMGQNIWEMSARGLAQQVAVLTQEFAPAFDMSVLEAVMMGRIPHRSSWSVNGARDRALVRECLEQVGCTALLDRDFARLSGGEKQRVLLARALAQQPQCLLLDEPTNHLDVRYQHELMALVRGVRGVGRSTLVVLHDLNIAAQYCDRLCLMHHGALVAQGTPHEVLTREHIAAVYGMDAVVDAHPFTGKPRVTFCA